jgi:hypothetical protein
MKNLSLAALFTLALTACGGGGSSGDGSAASAPSSPVPPAGTADFATRCAQPGVLRCVGFDSASDLAGTWGDNSGSLAGASTPVLDPTVKASGASSLKFTIPSNSPADTSGSYFTNFSADLQTQFSANAEFYVQWRQRFSPEFLNTVFTGGGGWKQAIIGAGDKPGCNAATSSNGLCTSSCTALETVVQNTFQRGFAQMYNSCTGSSSHGAFNPFEEPFGGDFKLQNARPSPFCLYSQTNTTPKTSFSPGTCIGYFPNEWMSFQVMIKTGPRVNDEWTPSFVTLWIGRQGQAAQTAITWGPYALTAASPGEDLKFGKVWLLPYNTGKSSAQTHPTGFTWYDELIISRTRIADPQ